MKLWIDDIRPAPAGFLWVRSVREAQQVIRDHEIMSRVSGGKIVYDIEILDMDHDAGDFASEGGDFIKLLDWMEATNRSYPVHLHTMNPVGRENMRRIIQRNGWKEVF